MSYKYSKGSQVIGDLKAADDTQRDTLIDFGEDVIDFQTAGSSVLKVSGSHVYLANGSDLHLAGNSTIYFDSDDGGSNINVSITERPDGNGIIFDGRNRLRFRADQYVIFEAPDGSEPILINFDANPDVLSLGMNLSSTHPISASALRITGKSVLNDDVTVAANKRIYLDGTGVSANQGPFMYGSLSTMYLDGDDNMYLYHDTRMSIFYGSNRIMDIQNGEIAFDTTISSSNSISASALHLQEGITNGGQTFLDSQGNLSAADANLSDVTSSNLSFSGDLFLNNTEKLIDSQGDHALLQTMVVELSIPGTDVQTDSSAFRFFCPYDLTVDELQLNLDENNSGEAVTVQISGSGGFTQSLTLTGPTDNGSTGSLGGSFQSGELLNFEITSVTGTPQGLIANLLYRRTLS